MKEENKENLKVIRLDNGEILFSKITVPENKNDGYLELQWPMRVYMKFNHEEMATFYRHHNYTNSCKMYYVCVRFRGRI
jgi:hypothetical protein